MTYLITYGSGALNTISCEVLWTERGESWADNFALTKTFIGIKDDQRDHQDSKF